VITIHQRYRQTDRQTDRRHAIPRPRICTEVHCAVKKIDLCTVYGYLNATALDIRPPEVFCDV